MIEIFKRNKKFLLFLFILSLLVRALVFHFYLSKSGKYWQVDSSMYHDLAISIADGKGLVNQEGKANFYRLPGYPIFLSIFYNVFDEQKYTQGDSIPGGNGLVFALWAQVLLASIIPLLIFFLSLTLFPSLLLAKIASLWSVFHLGFVLYSGFFMTESLFLFFFILFLIFFLKSVHLFFCSFKGFKEGSRVEIDFNVDDIFYKTYVYGFIPEPACEVPQFFELFEKEIKMGPKVRSVKRSEIPSPDLFIAGLLLGIAGIVRPVGHYLLSLAFIIILLSQGGVRKKLLGGITLFGGWLFPIAPWLIRNFVLTGHLFFHTLPGGHFLYLSAARVAMHEKDCSYWEARERLTEEARAIALSKEKVLRRKLKEIEESNVCEGLAVKYFKKRPLIALKNWGTDILRASLSLYSAELLYLEGGRAKFDYFKKGRSLKNMFMRYFWPNTPNLWLCSIVWGEILMFFLILLGFAAGFVKMCFRRWDVVVCSWTRSILFMGLFIVIALAGGYARMRLPVEPVLIILSLEWWISLISRSKCKTS